MSLSDFGRARAWISGFNDKDGSFHFQSLARLRRARSSISADWLPISFFGVDNLFDFSALLFFSESGYFGQTRAAIFEESL